MYNSVLEAPFVKGYVKMANEGYERGWHERNGGNLSYRIKTEEIESVKSLLDFSREFTPIGATVENLKNEYFLVSGSGKFFGNIKSATEENICIVEVDSTGKNYRIVWGLVKGGRPTSEFPSHYMNHSVRAAATNYEHRVIYHAHPVNLIAMTFITPLTAKDFSLALWRSATECPIVFPEGVGVVDWMVPGGADIAMATSELMKKYDAAVWAHHGLFCSGPDFDTTFGLMHTIEKAAEIYVKALSCGQGIRQTITDEQLLDIARDFGFKLNEELLG